MSLYCTVIIPFREKMRKPERQRVIDEGKNVKNVLETSFLQSGSALSTSLYIARQLSNN